MKLRSKISFSFLPAAILFLLSSCGEGTVDIGDNTYSPKIVIEGYIYPGLKVENIRITRNIPLASVPSSSIVLSGADVKIVDLKSGNEYSLTFNSSKFSFGYNGDDLRIEYGSCYKLFVSAVVDGSKLEASSITTVPQKGFKILKQESTLGKLKYREKNSEEKLKFFNIIFSPSGGTSYYPISIVALDATTENFIYDNAYFEVKPDDLEKAFDSFKYGFKAMQNVKSDADKTNYEVEWMDTWFYSRYRLIVYAADDNFRLFSQTHKIVQEFDGNFHEPRMNVSGDGIGVFGSAIADTVYFEVTK